MATEPRLFGLTYRLLPKERFRQSGSLNETHENLEFFHFYSEMDAGLVQNEVVQISRTFRSLGMRPDDTNRKKRESNQWRR